MIVVLSMLTAALTAIDTEQDKDNNNNLNEESKTILISQVHAYGYEIIKSIMSAIMFVLPKDYKTERVEDLIPLANKFADDIKDKEKFANILFGIMQKFNERDADLGILDCFESYSGFGKVVTEVDNIEKASFRITYSISKDIRNAIDKAGDGIFKAPNRITLQDFVTPGKELTIDPTNFLNPGGENLPGIIDMLAFLTSPYIIIKAVVNNDEAKVFLLFNGKKYIEEYLEIETRIIKSFVSSYLTYYRFLLIEQK